MGVRKVKKGTRGGWRMRSSGRRSEAVVKVACGVTQRWMCSLCRSPAGTIVKRADEDESRLGG